MGANLDETELALDAYPTLGEFFARKLRDGARTIDASPHSVIAPCDGVIAARGQAVEGTLVQAKGKNYRLADLVADPAYAERLTGGDYMTIYLSPRDYHRVHTPVSGQVTGYEFLPGALWPVNKTATRMRNELLSRNERVVIRLAGEFGECAIVMVGAAGVGNMCLSGWSNNPVGDGFESADYRLAGERRSVELHDVALERGDELGAFHLGSTVVMIFSRGSAQLAGEVGTAVRFGESLGDLA